MSLSERIKTIIINERKRIDEKLLKLNNSSGSNGNFIVTAELYSDFFGEVGSDGALEFNHIYGEASETYSDIRAEYETGKNVLMIAQCSFLDGAPNVLFRLSRIENERIYFSAFVFRNNIPVILDAEMGEDSGIMLNGKVTELADKSQIGGIEDSLESIITKYGLGGETE